MKEIKFDENILREYWILSGLEEAAPYSRALNKDKQSVAGTLGFQKYVLWISLQEVKKQICLALPKFIRKLFRNKC